MLGHIPVWVSAAASYNFDLLPRGHPVGMADGWATIVDVYPQTVTFSSLLLTHRDEVFAKNRWLIHVRHRSLSEDSMSSLDAAIDQAAGGRPKRILKSGGCDPDPEHGLEQRRQAIDALHANRLRLPRALPL